MKKFEFKRDAALLIRHIWAQFMCIALCVSALSACDKAEEDVEATQLDTPVLTVSDITSNSATISWEEISGAGSYHLIVTDSEETAVYDNTLEGQTSVGIDNLSPSTAYKVACTAIPSDTQLYSQSETGYKEFTTEGEVAVEQSFEISVGNVTSNTAEVTVIPAIKDQYYRIIAFREDLPDDVVLKMIVDDVTAYVGLYGWEHSVEEGLFFIGDTNNCMFDQFPDGYDARFFVVGFDYKDNAMVATTGLFKSEKFTTVEIVESNAWANMAPVSMVDKGNVIIGVNFTPNEYTKQIKAAIWNVYTGFGDPSSLDESGYTEAGIRGTLLGDDGTDIDMSDLNFASYAQPGTALLFGAIGLDESGVPGKANWIILKVLDAEGTFSVLCQSEDNESGMTIVAPDMTIEYTISDAASEHPVYSGCPLLSLKFTPNELCADYHYSVEEPGTFDMYGEYGAASYLMDQTMRWDPVNEWGWKERADTKDESDSFTDKDSFILMPYFKGQTAEVFYMCFEEDGTQSKAKCLKIDIPNELSAASVTSKTVGGCSYTGYRLSSVMDNSPRAHFGLR